MTRKRYTAAEIVKAAMDDGVPALLLPHLLLLGWVYNHLPDWMHWPDYELIDELERELLPPPEK